MKCLFVRFVSCSQRMDLGECPKVHDLALRADFDAASKKKDYYYDIEVRLHRHSLNMFRILIATFLIGYGTSASIYC